MSKQSDNVLRTTSSLAGKAALLVLEDGTVFSGSSCGAAGEAMGEICFDTSMAGYLEAISDPSYAGQIVSLTYPQIGNYGINKEDMESPKPALRGLVVRSICTQASNWRSEMSLPEFLNEQGVVAIEGVDTRALTRHIREQGTCKAIISSNDISPESLLSKLKDSPSFGEQNMVAQVSCSSPYSFTASLASGEQGAKLSFEPKHRVIVYDYGVKKSILKSLAQAGCDVRVVPWNTSAEEVLEAQADGVFLSNGPGNPDTVERSAEEIARLVGKLPMLGVGMGHQMICKAAGAQFEKLAFGHRGRNQAVFNLLTGRTEATTQNHSYHPLFSSLGDLIPELSGGLSEHAQDLRFWIKHGITPVIDNPILGRIALTHVQVNDGSLEGFACLDLPICSVQYHPETSFRVEKTNELFSSFVRVMEGKKNCFEASCTDGRSQTSRSDLKGGFWQDA